MASSPTKKIRVEVGSAIRDGFRERGWTAVRGRAGTFQAPEEVVSAPLALRVSVTIDADTFGGARLTCSAVIQSDAVTDVVVGFDRSSIPSALTAFPGDEMIRGTLNLGVETAGGLLDPAGNYHKWTVTELEGVASATGEFFALVDGRLLAWASARDTPAKLFAEVSDRNTPSRLRDSAIGIRAIAVLAFLQGRSDVARDAVAAYVPQSDKDTERFPLFERELAERFPEYGPLQRSLDLSPRGASTQRRRPRAWQCATPPPWARSPWRQEIAGEARAGVPGVAGGHASTPGAVRGLPVAAVGGR